MIRRKHALACAVSVLAFALASPSPAGLGDALKRKLDEKAKQKAGQAVDKAAEKAEQGASGKPKDAAATSPAAGSEEAPAAGGSPAGPATKVSEVSSKFDFVPGDKVILQDDFTEDDLGEFPARLKPVIGTFEVVESAGERWVRCMSPDGTVRLRLPEAPALPEYWTLEFDFYGTEPMSSALTVRGVAKGDHTVWEATFTNGEKDMFFRSGEFTSSTPLEGSPAPGRHHVMFMARGKGIKGYIDRERLVSLPEVSGTNGPVAAIDLRLWADNKPMFTNLRFAEGCKPAKDMLASGKLVTYGIRFATGSDVVLPESAPVLRQVAAWLQANPAAKLTVTGHTDNVGSPADNLDLSKRRAASVAKVLVDQFSIAADRFATHGKGDTQPLADNSKPEGRAMNRRVEFAKL
jgi:outer membrane protein OmpA-like peptidoglycan-associated protein